MSELNGEHCRAEQCSLENRLHVKCFFFFFEFVNVVCSLRTLFFFSVFLHSNLLNIL